MQYTIKYSEISNDKVILQNKVIQKIRNKSITIKQKCDFFCLTRIVDFDLVFWLHFNLFSRISTILAGQNS